MIRLRCSWRRRSAVAAALAAFCGVVTSAATARAEEQPIARAKMRQHLLDYYRAEKRTGYLLGGLGLSLAAGGAVLLTRDSELERGLAWSMAGFSAVGLIVGALYAWQNTSELSRYDTLLNEDPSGFRRQELAHIQSRRSSYSVVRGLEVGLATGGVALAAYGVLSEREIWQGAGIGVAAQALVYFFIDSLAHRRATKYQGSVRAFVPELGGLGTPFMIQHGSSF